MAQLLGELATKVLIVHYMYKYIQYAHYMYIVHSEKDEGLNSWES